MFYGLKATTRLRREEACTVVFSVEETGKLKYVHPIQATLLASCDGERTRSDLITVLCQAFGYQGGEATTLVEGTLADLGGFLVVSPESRELPRRYDPVDFVYRPHGDPAIHRLSAPIEIAWMVTRRCPFDCVYCCVPTRPANEPDPDELTTEEAFAFLEDCVATGIETFLIHGGEPFIRPDLPDLLAFLIEHDIHFTASTKLPLKESVVARLAEIGVEELQLSVDSSDPDTAARLVAHPSFLRGFYRNLELLQRYGIAPKANAVVTSMNVRHIPALVREVARRGGRELTMSNYLRSPHKHDDAYFASRDDLYWLVDRVRELRDEFPDMEIQTPSTASPREASLCADGLSACSGGKTGFVVGGDGSVSFCDRLIGHEGAIVGNVKRSSLMDIWYGYELEQFIDPAAEKFAGTACADCSMMSACNKRMRCYYRVQLVDRKFYGPDYLCPRVPEPETRFF